MFNVVGASSAGAFSRYELHRLPVFSGNGLCVNNLAVVTLAGGVLGFAIVKIAGD